MHNFQEAKNDERKILIIRYREIKSDFYSEYERLSEKSNQWAKTHIAVLNEL